MSFLRLQPHKSSNTDEAEANHLSDFHSLLKGSPNSKARKTLEQATWAFWIVISDRIDAAEGQRIFQLLACVINTMSTPEQSDRDLDRHWRGQSNPARSHNDALSTMSETSHCLSNQTHQGRTRNAHLSILKSQLMDPFMPEDAGRWRTWCKAQIRRSEKGELAVDGVVTRCNVKRQPIRVISSELAHIVPQVSSHR